MGASGRRQVGDSEGAQWQCMHPLGGIGVAYTLKPPALHLGLVWNYPDRFFVLTVDDWE